MTENRGIVRPLIVVDFEPPIGIDFDRLSFAVAVAIAVAVDIEIKTFSVLSALLSLVCLLSERGYQFVIP